MKEIVQCIDETVIIEWFYTLQKEYKDGKRVPIFINEEEEKKGNFSGLAKHKGKVNNVELLVSDLSGKLIPVKISVNSFLEIANRLTEINQLEADLLCEDD